MTNKDKKELANAVMYQIGNLMDVYQDDSGYWNEIQHLDPDEVAKQLQVWLKNLPFDRWDSRIKAK